MFHFLQDNCGRTVSPDTFTESSLKLSSSTRYFCMLFSTQEILPGSVLSVLYNKQFKLESSFSQPGVF